MECAECESTFSLSILSDREPSGEFTPHFKQVIFSMMITIAEADGEVHQREIEEIRDICRSIELGNDIPKDIGRYSLKSDNQTKSDRILKFLSYSRAFLNTAGREKVFIAALRIVKADRIFHPREHALLKQIGDALGLGRAKTASLIKDVIGSDSISPN